MSERRESEATSKPRRVGLWDELAHDVRFGLRSLRRSPGYTLAAVGVLALGIGANTAIFSVVRGVLLAPLPFRHGEQLMLISQSAPAAEVTNAGVSIPELGAYRERLTTVRDLVEYHGMSFTLLRQGEPDRVDTGVVSANFFDMLGVRPLHGRSFVHDDEVHGAEAVLVLSHPYWQEKFGGDPGVIGKVVEMNDRPHTIVGILPDLPQYPRDNDVYMPTSACPHRDLAAETLSGGWRTFAGLTVFGRLAPGSTPEQASAEVAGVSRSFARQHPEDYERVRGLVGRVEPLQENLVRNARPMLLTLTGTVLLVLLIACANVANLSIARTARRGRELAVRTALGAGRPRLFRLLMTESVLVAMGGGVVGIAVAWLGQGMLVDFVGRFTSRTGQVELDGVVLVFALATAVLTGLVFGAAPALASRRNLSRQIREGAAQSGDGAGRHRLRSGLVVAQVAVSFVLLVGAALLLESFRRLAAVEVGYETRRVMTADISGAFAHMHDTTPAVRVHGEILDRLRNAPAVVSAAITTAVPLSNIAPGVLTIEVEGGEAAGQRRLQVDPNVASEGYFETLGIPLLGGRTFRMSDTAEAPPVAVINQSMAKLWGDRPPVGSRFRVDAPSGSTAPNPWITVVGVVADFKLYELDREVEPQFYAPYQQSGGAAERLLVRTAGDPHELIPAIKESVHQVNGDMPVEELQTLAELRSGRLAAPKLTAALLAIFAGVALLVTLSGIAGVIGTSVSQRTRELGIRMALGATRASVLQMVLAEGVLLIAAGLGIGLAGAFAFGRLLERFLFATRPTEPLAYAAVGGILLLAALVASFAPARRATRVQPIVAFKTD